MQHGRVTRWSESDYLRAERAAVVRHEYVAGQLFAMPGGSKAHSTIALNIAARLRTHLRGRPCRAFIADMKVRIEGARSHCYPDVVVTCDAADLAPASPRDYLTAPSLIVEVLSASTESIDRREKLLAYAQLPGRLEYVLVDSASRRVDIYRQEEDGEMVLEIPAPDEPVHLDSVGLELTFEEIYEESGID